MKLSDTLAGFCMRRPPGESGRWYDDMVAAEAGIGVYDGVVLAKGEGIWTESVRARALNGVLLCSIMSESVHCW